MYEGSPPLAGLREYSCGVQKRPKERRVAKHHWPALLQAKGHYGEQPRPLSEGLLAALADAPSASSAL
jgi:hypothetical protein